MRKSYIAGGAIVVLAGLAGLATAAEPYLPRVQKAFDRIDANHDGKLTSAEFLPLAQKRFLRDDGNGDGAVSTAEIDQALKSAMERRRNRILATMDADKDGTISKTELDKFAEALVKGADTDADGGVTLAEVRGFRLAKWRKTMQDGTPN